MLIEYMLLVDMLIVDMLIVDMLIIDMLNVVMLYMLCFIYAMSVLNIMRCGILLNIIILSVVAP